MKKDIDFALLLIRITIAGLMLFHGIAKLGHLDGIQNMLGNAGLPEFLSYGVYITELIAPVLILIGWRTRLAALVFASGMFMALFLKHSENFLELSKTGGLAIELILLFTLPAIALFFSGGGIYAVSTKHNWD